MNPSRAAQRFALLFLLAGLLPTMYGQTPQQTELILKRLDQLEKQNAELLTEMKALRESLAKPDAQQANSPAAVDPEKTAEREEVSEHRIEELAQTKIESSQRFPIQLTGMALFNAFVNGANSGGAQDPVSASAAPGLRNSGASFRQSVLGLKFDGPQTLWGGAVSGSLFMDFFGGSTASLNHLVRLRVATVQIAWAHTTFAVGQDKPLVSRREPNSLAQVGVSPLTGAGNPWLWQPQARIEQRFRLNAKTDLKAEAGIFQTSENSNAGLKFEAARPAFEARLSLRRQFGDDRLIEIAPVLHTSTSHIGGASIPSRLYGVDWLVRPIARLEVTGLVFHGKNFANLGALGGTTLTATGTVIPVRGTGGWIQFRYLATRKLSFNAYGGQQDDRDVDLQSRQIGKNQYYAGNTMYLVAPNVVAAFEAGQNRTDYLGLGTRLNNHYDVALAYLF